MNEVEDVKMREVLNGGLRKRFYFVDVEEWVWKNKVERDYV